MSEFRVVHKIVEMRVSVNRKASLRSSAVVLSEPTSEHQLFRVRSAIVVFATAQSCRERPGISSLSVWKQSFATETALWLGMWRSWLVSFFLSSLCCSSQGVTQRVESACGAHCNCCPVVSHGAWTLNGMWWCVWCCA